MQKPSILHLEALVKTLGSLRLRDTRALFATLRDCGAEPGTSDDVALCNGFLPKFGCTVGEVGFAYIVNQPSRSSNRKTS